MRTNVYCQSGEYFDRPERELKADDKMASIDWKESPADVLEQVDRLLQPHGLEVVIFTCQGDCYEFAIWKRGENPPETETTILK